VYIYLNKNISIKIARFNNKNRTISKDKTLHKIYTLEKGFKMKTIYILFFIALVLIPIKSMNQSTSKNTDKHINLIFSKLYVSTSDFGFKKE